MDVTKLTDIVKDVWNFIWPPVIQLAILIALLRVIAPMALGKLTARLRSLVDRQRGAIAILRLYGLRKFVPFIAAFVILFVLYVGQQCLEGFGQIIPGQVTYTPSAAWLHHASTEETACFLARHPGADLSDIENLVDLEKATLKAKGDSGARVFASDYARSPWTFRALNLTKAFSLLAIVLWFTELVVAKAFVRPLAAMVLCQVICVSVAAYLVYTEIDAYDQRTWDYVRDSKVLASMAGFHCDDLPTRAKLEVQKAVWQDIGRDSTDGRWWQIRFEGSEALVKARRFLEGEPHTVGRFVEDLLPIAPPGNPSPKPLERALSGFVSEQYLKSDVAADSQLLASQGFFPPDILSPQDQLRPGTIVVRDEQQSGYTAVVPAWIVFRGTPAEDGHIPSMRLPVRECTPILEVLSKEHIRSAPYPFDEGLNQNLAVVTEIVGCIPQKGQDPKPIILGYKLARME